MEVNCLIVELESIKPLICKGSRDANCRRALFFFVLEITSFTLDLLGKNQMGFLIAQFLLSTLVFGITFDIYFVKKRNIAAGGTTISVAEKQLIGEEIGCAIVQFVVPFICLILKANYNASVFPLLYSAISVWFAFTRIKEVADSLPQQRISEDVDVEAASRHVDTSSVDSAASRLRHRRNPSDLHESYQKRLFVMRAMDQQSKVPSMIHYTCRSNQSRGQELSRFRRHYKDLSELLGKPIS